VIRRSRCFSRIEIGIAARKALPLGGVLLCQSSLDMARLCCDRLAEGELAAGGVYSEFNNCEGSTRIRSGEPTASQAIDLCP